MTEKDKIIKKEDAFKEGENKKTLAKKQNKTLGNILVFIGILFLVLIISFIVTRASNNPSYKGVTFNVIKEGELTFYQTAFKVLYKGENATYNIYLRNNPKELAKEVPFNGKLNLKNNLVLNTTTENLFCDGDWNLAIGNLQNLKIFNINIMRDENASCSSGGEYMFVQIEEGNETRIEQYGPSCYKLIVSDCEILPVTERFMIETFAKVDSMLAK
jgi:hypothetical protein